MHSIRLRGPWQYTPLATTRWTRACQSEETGTEVPCPGTMNIPCDWSNSLGQDFQGKVLFQRHFHKPTGLKDEDNVRIRIEQVNALADVFLNHEAIGTVKAEDGSTVLISKISSNIATCWKSSWTSHWSTTKVDN